MDRTEAFNQVVEILTPYAKNAEALANVSESSSILDDLDVNSARLIDIVLAMEDRFGIAIDDDDADRVATIADALEVIAKCQAA